MSTTPNMFLDLPVVSSTLGPAWASALNAALFLVDSHNHTSGSGVQVPAAGLSIDDALSFGGNDATLLRSTRFDPQSATLGDATDLRCLYAVAGNLYFNNASGTPVQITDGASLSATSLGGITGLPSGTASVAFATSTYTFNSATNTRATMDVGPLVVHDTTALSNGVTIAPPAGLASAYALTLFSALPGSTMFVRLTSGGVLAADVAPDGTSIEVSGATFRVKDGGITRAMQASVGQQVSAGYASLSSGASTTYAAVPKTGGGNLSVSITSTGRPIMISLVPDASAGSSAYMWLLSSGTSPCICNMQIAVTGAATATIGSVRFGKGDTTVSGDRFWFSPGVFGTMLYVPAAGTYTLTLQYKVENATTVLTCSGFNLVAYEL